MKNDPFEPIAVTRSDPPCTPGVVVPMKLGAVVLIMALAALSSCAVYQPRPIDPQSTLQSFEARTLDSAELKRFIERNAVALATPWPRANWSLDALTLAAFYYHPDLDAARARLGTTEAAQGTAAQRPLPTAQVPLGYNADSGADPPWTVGLALGVTIETAGKRGYRIAQAQQTSRSAQFNLGQVAWQVRGRLRDRMLTLYGALGSQVLLERQAAAQDAIVQMLAKRLALGEASGSEAALARITLNQNRLAVSEAQRVARDARALVAAAIGITPEVFEQATLSFVDFEALPTQIASRDLRRQALLNRSDWMAALADYEASQSALQLEFANQYPDVRLGPGYTWDSGANKFSFGVGLPVFSINRNRPAIAEAQARRVEAATRAMAVQAQALGDASRAAEDFDAARHKVTVADELLASDRRQFALVERSFRAGETDRLALMLAQHAVYADEVARLDAAIKVQQALGLLEDAMQRPIGGAAWPTLAGFTESARAREMNDK